MPNKQIPFQKLCVTCNSCHLNEQLGANECRRHPPTVLPTQRVNPLTKQMEMGIASVYPPLVTTSPSCDDYMSKISK